MAVAGRTNCPIGDTATTFFAAKANFRLDRGALKETLKPHDQLSQLNVLVQLEHLLSYPIVNDRVLAGILSLNAWWFEIATGYM